MIASRRTLLLAAFVAVIALMAFGTVLWIMAILRPAPEIAPAPVVARHREAGVVVLTVDLAGKAPIDRLGATVEALGMELASGRAPTADPHAAVAIEARAPALRLVFDRGVLVAGAISGQSPDHLLGLAGAGSRWPDPKATYAYCGRVETALGTFCKQVRSHG